MARIKTGRKSGGPGDGKAKGNGDGDGKASSGPTYEGLKHLTKSGVKGPATFADSVSYRQGFVQGKMGTAAKPVSSKSKVLSTDYARMAGRSEGMRARTKKK